MGKRIVEITQTALDDMEGIYDYIADVLLAAENAMGQYNRIADAILTLESNPERCPVFEVEPERSWRMRRIVEYSCAGGSSANIRFLPLNIVMHIV